MTYREELVNKAIMIQKIFIFEMKDVQENNLWFIAHLYTFLQDNINPSLFFLNNNINIYHLN